jgi:hypothetical protein
LKLFQGPSICRYGDENEKCCQAKVIIDGEDGVCAHSELLHRLYGLQQNLSFPKVTTKDALDLVYKDQLEYEKEHGASWATKLSEAQHRDWNETLQRRLRNMCRVVGQALLKSPPPAWSKRLAWAPVARKRPAADDDDDDNAPLKPSGPVAKSKAGKIRNTKGMPKAKGGKIGDTKGMLKDKGGKVGSKKGSLKFKAGTLCGKKGEPKATGGKGSDKNSTLKGILKCKGGTEHRKKGIVTFADGKSDDKKGIPKAKDGPDNSKKGSLKDTGGKGIDSEDVLSGACELESDRGEEGGEEESGHEPDDIISDGEVEKGTVVGWSAELCLPWRRIPSQKYNSIFRTEPGLPVKIPHGTDLRAPAVAHWPDGASARIPGMTYADVQHEQNNKKTSGPDQGNIMEFEAESTRHRIVLMQKVDRSLLVIATEQSKQVLMLRARLFGEVLDEGQRLPIDHPTIKAAADFLHAIMKEYAAGKIQRSDLINIRNQKLADMGLKDIKKPSSVAKKPAAASTKLVDAPRSAAASASSSSPASAPAGATSSREFMSGPPRDDTFAMLQKFWQI